ncbi:hypothetical protein Q5752_000458 [Cryptotrichosporon argae]
MTLRVRFDASDVGGDENSEAFSLFDVATWTDAQKWSLIAFGISFALVVLLWRGIPYGRATYRNKKTGDTYEGWKTFPILWPFKILTVLWHEMSHAIVGVLTGGRVEFISVDAYEGGLTEFKAAPARQPRMALVLPAGYIGSCMFGCALLFCGFDTRAAKYCLAVFGAASVLSTLVCAFTLTKFGIYYHSATMPAKIARRCCPCTGAVKASEKRWHNDLEVGRRMRDQEEDEYGETPEDKMVSLDIMIAVQAAIAAGLALLWYCDDSVALRFAFIWLGSMSALYACADIVQDGLMVGAPVESDCGAMQALYNARVDAYNEKHGHKRRKHHVGEHYYALCWLAISAVTIVATLVGALCVFTQTTAEQAAAAEAFLPSPEKYGPAEFVRSAWASATDAS